MTTKGYLTWSQEVNVKSAMLLSYTRNQHSFLRINIDDVVNWSVFGFVYRNYWADRT